MKLGEKQTLTISRFKEFGAYLTDDGSDSVLLPKKEVPQGAKEGDSVEVFLYKDSQDRLIATVQDPIALGGPAGAAQALPAAEAVPLLQTEQAARRQDRELQLEGIRQLARQDPATVANVVRNWASQPT